jgi:hypothetical protein
VWNVEIEIIPTIIGAIETITKLCRKYLSSITGKHNNQEMQTKAILATAHILRKVLL